MAMHSGVGLTKILVIVGAGYTGSILLKNGKLSDVLSELQTLVKDKSGDSPEGSYADALEAQVRRLAMEVRQLASARPITILNGGSGKAGNITAFLVPAAALGALGYGFMKWKGLKLSDLMYVTKRNMASAVTNMTKHLEQVSAALAATKRHLTQRIENLDGKLDDQKEMSKLIKNEVGEVRLDISQIGDNLLVLHNLVHGLDGRIDVLEGKQDLANVGVLYLCQAVGGQKDPKLAELMQSLPKATQRRQLGFSNDSSGLKTITEALMSGVVDQSKANATMPLDADNSGKIARSVKRTFSIKC